MALLEIRNIRKDFTSGSRTTNAVRDVSFTIESGEFVALTGKSGAGKSTVLNICAGMLKPNSGSVKYDGEELYLLNRVKLAEFRRRQIGYVFQRFNLIPMLTARENIAIPSLLDDKKPDEVRMNELAETLGIAERLDHFPGELSGGEQQRVAIARAVAAKPPIIMADEPTGNLDSASGLDIMQQLTALNEQGTSIILITHDNHLAQMAKRIVTIQDGRIISDAPTEGGSGT